ncbi:MAG: dTDP-4-dehydrorhamnose 3,5-epimerase [Alloprevotella sp.]|nr:dTDP-4-dehydrorhamnose 3,5-epimerase [Alloprevotella sp.]
MEYIKTSLQDVWICEPHRYEDARGYFMETWREEEFNRHVGLPVHFVQDNQSKSVCGVLRGLHYQRGEYAQAKLVRVLQGCVIDVAVDLRRQSPTFGKYLAVELSESNNRMLFVPRGFAHGFQVISPEAVFAYKVDNIYAPAAEECIRYDDPTLQIAWPITDPARLILSEKDATRAKRFEDAVLF